MPSWVSCPAERLWVKHGVDPVGKQHVRIIIVQIVRIVNQAGVIEIDILIAAGHPQFQIIGVAASRGKRRRYKSAESFKTFWS